ncbi:hypothetical protein D9619_005615 [Psilocybe cf. subviscida]|uniref:Sulphur transport domain-containing protein n=1 Tax=Psilocybe cf. subviscida TaxID=2480587 RepID=A0A8H5FBK3_9AGAR|nr:hypothetical protein D9619_005615 [Psilocybe cf. subviscida]
MSSPTPIQSLIGGMGIPLAAHELLVLNGNIFGISGFLHSAVRGSVEGLAGAAGLVLGGMIVANLEGAGPATTPLSASQMALSGLLVGLGTKLANGCTSGHMICGISRFSIRSIAATATFFLTGVLTTLILHGNQPAAAPPDWTLGMSGVKLLALQAIPFGISALLYALNSKSDKPEKNAPVPARKALRILAYFATSVQFALALRLSNLSEASRVLSFLVLPFNRGFDPSLAFVAGGAVSLGIFLYHCARGSERPRLGGVWSIPKGGKIDVRLLVGSTMFGIGWGMAGICPGPGLVNLGRALGSGGSSLLPYTTWIGSMVVGGILA